MQWKVNLWKEINGGHYLTIWKHDQEQKRTELNTKKIHIENMSEKNLSNVWEKLQIN